MKDKMNNLPLQLNTFEKALNSLIYIAKKPREIDRVNINATIQRFEFTFELCWKTLRLFLNNEGIQVYYPKDVLKESYSSHLIGDEQLWLGMLQDRNLSFHTYNEELADQIYYRIHTYIPVLQETFNKIKGQIKQ